MWTWGGNPPMMRTQNSIKDTTSAQTRKFEILTVGIIYKKKLTELLPFYVIVKTISYISFKLFK